MKVFVVLGFLITPQMSLNFNCLSMCTGLQPSLLFSSPLGLPIPTSPIHLHNLSPSKSILSYLT